MKIMKYLLLLLFTFVLIPSCLHSSEKGDVEQFYNFMQAGALDKAYSLLSEKDQEHMSSKEFIGKSESQQLVNKKYWSYVKYRILSSSKINEDVTVKVELTAPNIGKILGEEIAESLIRINSKNSSENGLHEKKRTTLLLNRLVNVEFSYIVFEETVHVLAEGSQQKIFLNLERDEEIFQLIQEAIAYGKDNKFDLAVEKLEKVLALNPENSIANQYMEIMLKEKK